jgi:hypothetical protein
MLHYLSSQKKRLFWAIVVFFTCATPLALANEAIFTAMYKGRYNGWNIQLERKLVLRQDGSYFLSSSANHFLGSILESSHFLLGAHGFSPLQYEYSRKIMGKPSSEFITFNWKTLRAEYTRTQKPSENAQHTAAPGILDPVLYQLQLQKDLARQKSSLQYSFLKRRDKKDYHFKIIGKESFSVDKRQYQALLVERTTESKKKTRLWILPELDYQIAKIQHKEESGDTYSIELFSYTSNKQKMADFYLKGQL